LTLKTPIPNFSISSKISISPLPIKVKVHRTGQIITPTDPKYITIYRIDQDTYVFSFIFYSTLTRLALKSSYQKDKIIVKVEDYQHGPIFKTSCDIFIFEKKVMSNVNELSVGSQVEIQLSKLLAPELPAPKLKKVVREGPLRRIVHVDTFGVQCGIATYLENLMDPMIPLNKEIEHIVFAESIPPGDTRSSSGKDYKGNQPILVRNWTRKHPAERLLKDLAEFNPEILHIQHEWAFFNATSPILIEIFKSAKERGTVNIVTWHTVYGRNETDSRTLSIFFRNVKPLIDMHIVHEKNSYNNLISFDIEAAKIRLIPMSAYPVKDIPKDEARRKMLPEKYWKKKILVTGGFLLPNKGIEKIIFAISILNDPELTLVCIGGSHPWSERVYKDYHHLIQETAKQTGVDLYLDYRFMDDEEIAYYMACADINILYYGWTLSGTSGWSRRAIAAKRPIICTDVRLMSDLQNEVHCLKVPPGDISILAQSIKRIFEDERLGEILAGNAAKYAEEISHENTAKRLLQLYTEVYEECRK